MTRVLFIADQFGDAPRGPSERHPGGAELTDEAAIQACPWPLSRITLRQLSAESPHFLDAFELIVLANSETATAAQLQQIARTKRHVLFEHDLRICRYRGNFPSGRDPLHRTRQRCWCPHLEQRALFDSARGVVFLTALQERYYRANPFFECGQARVLGSSLFGASILDLPAHAPRTANAPTVIFASRHPVKGYAQAKRHCRERGIQPLEIANLPPAAVLQTFQESESFVYLPIGPEWAGRMVIEARLLGCNVVANDLVGVTGEPVWRSDRASALEFLANGPRRFWSLVEELMAAPSSVAERPPSPSARGFEQLAALLRAPRSAFWPRGPNPLRSPPPRHYAAW